MLAALCARASERKLRLFACACGRCVWHLLRDGVSRQAVETAERYADGQACAEELAAVWEMVQQVLEPSLVPSPQDLWSTWETGHVARVAAGAARVRRAALSMAASAADREAPQAAQLVVQSVDEALGPTGRGQVLRLLEEIFGPFAGSAPLATPAVLAWHGSLVLHLAREIYTEKSFERMPILADALLDAGCDNEELMTHCRRRGNHVLGCWALDVLLGQT
jgi:hypothetical protein